MSGLFYFELSSGHFLSIAAASIIKEPYVVWKGIGLSVIQSQEMM